MRYIHLLMFAGALFVWGPVFACSDHEYEQCAGPVCICLPKADIGVLPGPIPIPIPIPVPSGQGIPVPTPGQVGQAVGANLQNISNEAAIALRNIRDTLVKADSDIKNNLDKSGKDVEAEIQRAGKDTEQAISAIGRYLERTAQDTGKSLTDADRRVREGKVIDAIWHMGIAPIQSAEKNTGQAVMESSVLRTVGQVASTAYGGPGGAAAYAAGLTYRETGDVNLAVRAGVLTGATSYAMGAAGKIPSDPTYGIAKKVIVTGAIGGAAVAAAGGNEAAVKEAFLKAGAMVVIQDTFKRMDGHDLDGKAAEGQPYCVSAAIASLNGPPPECAPPPSSYVRKADGSLELDSKGVPKVDMSKVDPGRAAVGTKSAEASFGTENSVPMKAVAQVPGMQGMAVFHDQWAMKWDMGALTTPVSIVPAVVLTYWGLGAPYYEDLRVTTRDAKERELRAINRSLNIPSEATTSNPAPGKVSLIKNRDEITQSYLCGRGAMSRMILVEKPVVTSTFACRVIYSTERGESVEWLAEHNANYCEIPARKFAEKQAKMGFECAQSAMNRR